MIFAEKIDAEEKEFINLLSKTRELLLSSLKDSANISPLAFEYAVYDKMTESAKGSNFEGTIKQTGLMAFPDVVANKYFGVEVKTTTKDQWISVGNSVLESSRIEDVERIYLLFGKFGGIMDIRYRLYQDCLPEVSVTHYPRYKINMDLENGKSIFRKIGIDYDTLRKDGNCIQKIKDYYRTQLKEGEELWWIDQDNGEKGTSPIIRPFKNLSKKERESFVVEAMILFPEMFSNRLTKFERAATYLVAEYNAVSANLRDNFTAGGKKAMTIKNKSLLLPRVAYKLSEKAKNISQKIEEINENDLLHYWRVEKIEKDRLSQWKKLLNEKSDYAALNIKASDIFEAGLI